MKSTDFLARLASGDDSIRGTDGDDLVAAPERGSLFQPSDVIRLGAGKDTIVMEQGGFLRLGAVKFENTTGLDAIDMTAAAEVHFSGNDALLAQSDDGIVRLIFGNAPMLLDLRDMAAPAAGYLLDGTGAVELLNIDQTVRVADGVAGTVLGGERSDTITGGSGNDDLSGGLGRDVLRGGGGDDVLSGGEDHDDLRGGSGDDTIRGGAGFDRIAGGTGQNTLSGGAQSDIFVIDPGSAATIVDFDQRDPYERIDLSAFDGLAFRDLEFSGADTARIRIDANTSLRLQGVSANLLTADDFVFSGQPFVSLADGLGAAADFIFSSGTDSFRAGSGSQVFDLIGSFSNLSAGDRFDGGAGIDTLRIGGADRSLSIARLEGMSGIEVIDLSGATGDHGFNFDPAMMRGTEGGTLTLRHGAGTLMMEAIAPKGAIVVEGTGAVTLNRSDGQAVTISDAMGGDVTGDDGGDLITGGAQDDRITGRQGDDTLSGGGGDDWISGGSGEDVLIAGGGDDTLVGGDDDDVFRLGGAGNVTVTGSDGFDTYIVAPGEGRITITDFDTVNYLERIDLSATAIRGPGDVDMTISGSDVRITGEGLDLVLEGAAGAHFGANDFLLAGQRDDRFQVEANAPVSALQPLLDGAPDGSVITLGAGIYKHTAPLVISRSDITVTGAGEGKTVFVNHIRDRDLGDANGQTFLVMPEKVYDARGTLARDAAEGARSVTLQSGHGLKEGDILFIGQPNDAAFLAETGNTGWIPRVVGHADRTWLREFRSRVEKVDGNTVTVAEPVTYDFKAGVARVRESLTLSDVHLSDFTIQGRWGRADTYDFTNTNPAWSNTSAIEFNSVSSSSLRDITILDTASTGLRLQRSYEVTGENLTVDGSHNKSGSNGIHFMINESFSNRLTGLESYGARHAVEFSASNAEHYNVIQANFVDRDINFHGSPDADNTVLVTRMVMDYPEGVFPQWRAVSPGVFPLHPYPTIEENDVTFLHARTGARPDDVTANKAGGFLSTGDGGDTLTGGAGNDTLIGGEQADVLRGNGGSDRFVWGPGDGRDTILDFQTGRGGDVLVLRNTGLNDVSQLRFYRADGETWLDTGNSPDISFGSAGVRGFSAANVVFENGGAQPLVANPSPPPVATAGADRMIGGAGTDRLAGGAGTDVLTGGGGRDIFVFEVPGTAFRGADRITDFTPGTDRILLDIPDGMFANGQMPAAHFSASGQARDRNDHVIYDRATGELSIDINGSASGGETVIARLDGAPDLTAADIFLV